jgi:phosphate transport system permease protein
MATISGRFRAPRRNYGDRVFGIVLGTAGLIAPLLVVLFVGVLIYSARLSIREFGWGFLTSTEWNPGSDHEVFGALVFVVGTLVSSLLAMALAVPIGIGVAIFLNEILPARVRSPFRFLIEILATIPSVVFGIWGLFVLVPWVRQVLEPALAGTLGRVPYLQMFFHGPKYGFGMLAAILMLAIMVIPIIVSVSMDALRMVSTSYREAALALGATRWEMIRLGVLPPARSGLVGGCVLALGRALGETMAVTMVIGNGQRISASLFAASDTVASSIANQFTEAASDLYTSALIELALILFCVTLTVNLIARWIVRRLAGRWSPPV